MMSTASTAPLPWPPPRSSAWSPEERDLTAAIDPARLPVHVAVIMDGNGRWAKSRGFFERIRGHEAGIDSVRETVRTCRTLGVRVLTLYSFSKENWVRPKAEVTALMRLLERFLIEEREEMMENSIKLAVIGKVEDLPDRVQGALAETLRLTSGNSAMTLVLALSYGGRDEIVRAAREMARRAAAGEIKQEEITEASFGELLDTAGLPDPDLLIRTSGEQRTSNFMPWQIAYAEFHITPVLWPDFRRPDLLRALIDYQGRDRRFGQVGEPNHAPKG